MRPVESPGPPAAAGSGPVVAPPTVEPAGSPAVEPADGAKDTERREVLARITERVEGFVSPQADTF